MKILNTFFCFVLLGFIPLITIKTNAASSDESSNKNSLIDPDSLLHYAYNIHSQVGEDGILQEILNRLNIKEGFFVEFGAWDGVFLSNARILVEQGWSGAFIEADPWRFWELQNNYKDIKNILCIKEFISFSKKESTGESIDEIPTGESIDEIADKYFANQEIDFMSIDIDGADYLILEGLKRKPKILCVEGGFSWNPKFTSRVPDQIAFGNLQQPLAVMIEIGRKNGYEPICFTQNVFFIRNDLYEPFKMIKNDAVTLWKDAWYNLSPTHKAWLLDFRATNPSIRNTEGDAFINLDLNE